MKFLRRFKDSLLLMTDLLLCSAELALYLHEAERFSRRNERRAKSLPAECISGVHKTLVKLTLVELAKHRASRITCSHSLGSAHDDELVAGCGRPSTWRCRDCLTSLCASHAWTDRPGMVGLNPSPDAKDS